jgi:hypothetical protein
MARPQRWYDPGATAPVEVIATGVVGDVETGGGPPGASIATPDRAAIHLDSPEFESFDLLYQPTYIAPQPGQAFAFALTATECAGVFRRTGDEILLPTNDSVDLQTFARAAIGRPIADYYGIHAPLE